MLTGALPALPPSVVYFDVENNMMNGLLPSFNSNTALEELWINNNDFSGILPSFAAAADKLLYVYAQDNSLSGETPSFAANTELILLYLNNNSFTRTGPAGSCPRCLAGTIGLCEMYGNPWVQVTDVGVSFFGFGFIFNNCCLCLGLLPTHVHQL